MKTSLFTAIFVLLATLPIKTLPSFSAMKMEEKKDIKLEGRTEDDDKKSLVLPFGAYQEDNQEISIISYDVCSNVSIYIYNASGRTMDYYTSELSSLQVVSFNIQDYSDGIYTLVISTPTGTYLTGIFEI